MEAGVFSEEQVMVTTYQTLNLRGWPGLNISPGQYLSVISLSQQDDISI